MSTADNIFEEIAEGIANGIVASFTTFVTQLILGFLNPILEGLGFPPVVIL
jgi:hypothetical protein